jgi:hypothetical protein
MEKDTIIKTNIKTIYDDFSNILEVPYFDKDLIMYEAKFHKNDKFKNKLFGIEKMLNYYGNDRLYEQIDCLCSKKLDFCIINTNADNLRKIYETNNYKENQCYASFFKK